MTIPQALRARAWSILRYFRQHPTLRQTISTGREWAAPSFIVGACAGARMPGHEPLDCLPLWVLFGTTVVLILLAVEAGFWLGTWRQRRAEHERETPVGAIVGAILGLLAFLLAFTFGMAASRFDTRRELVLAE